MKPLHADAQSIGAHLDSSESPVLALLRRARSIEEIQLILREWAADPWSRALRVANARDGIVVVLADSAAAFTKLRYRQQDLLLLLRQKLGNPDLRLEIKLRTVAQQP